MWTVHEIYPHIRRSRADAIAPWVVSRFADALIVHDESTRQKVVRTLKKTPAVIPHGSFAGIYRPGRPRSEVREALGVSDDTTVVLSFGHVSRYKNLEALVSVLALLPQGAGAEIAIVVAGLVMDTDVSDLLQEAARNDDRLRLLFRFIHDDEVVELFDACDVAIVTRVDDGTSGVLVLALSLGVPLIVADTPGYRSLTAQSTAKCWYFSVADPPSLAGTICTAADEMRRAEGRTDRTPRGGPDWSLVGERTAEVLFGAGSTAATSRCRAG